MGQVLEQYCQQLNALLPCPPEDAKRCIADVRQSAKRLREEQPEITADEIRDFLGEPQDVAQMFLDTLDPVRVERYRRRKKRFIRLLIGVLTVALCGALYAAYYFLTTPQCIYEQVTYIYESREASPDDPKAVNPYQ